MRSHVSKNRLLTLSCYSVLVSVPLSVCISATPTGRISVKFNSGDFYEKLSRISIFGCNQSNISGILHEDVSTYCFRLHKCVISALLCNTLSFILFALTSS